MLIAEKRTHEADSRLNEIERALAENGIVFEKFEDMLHLYTDTIYVTDPTTLDATPKTQTKGRTNGKEAAERKQPIMCVPDAGKKFLAIIETWENAVEMVEAICKDCKSKDVNGGIYQTLLLPEGYVLVSYFFYLFRVCLICF